MYTIKQVAARTGLGAPRIRAWERRYHVLEPMRASSGYRLYDERSITILLAMRALTAAGWAASEAARAITAAEVDLEGLARSVERPRAGFAGVSHLTNLVGSFVSAAEASDQGAVEAALDGIMSAGSFEAVVDDLLLPAAAALGDAWSKGHLSVAGEHAASAAVARRLGTAFEAAGVADRSSPVIVGLPPGSRHELGALAFAVALRRRGIAVLYVGADVPIDGWLDVVRRTHARAAVIGVVTEADRAPAAAVLTALRQEPAMFMAVGGAAADGVDGGLQEAIPLPARVVDAAVVVDEAVARGRRSRA